MLSLNRLGKRIMVLGPSNAGKSTLALAISEKIDVPVVYLDQLQHCPHTDWKTRPEAEFQTLHAAAIEADSWVMDGNYSRLMPARFERATGVILLRSNHWLRLFRYVKRCLRQSKNRVGGLEGGRENIKWHMIHWILFKTPKSHLKYSKMAKASGLPFIECQGPSQLDALYSKWGLGKPKS